MKQTTATSWWHKIILHYRMGIRCVTSKQFLWWNRHLDLLFPTIHTSICLSMVWWQRGKPSCIMALKIGSENLALSNASMGKWSRQGFLNWTSMGSNPTNSHGLFHSRLLYVVYVSNINQIKKLHKIGWNSQHLPFEIFSHR